MRVTRVPVLGGCHVVAGVLGLPRTKAFSPGDSLEVVRRRGLTYAFGESTVRFVDAIDWLDTCATRVMGSASSDGNALKKSISPGRMMRWS